MPETILFLFLLFTHTLVTPGLQSSCFSLLTIVGITGACDQAQLLVELGFCEFFCLAMWNPILPISVSQVVRITGVSHWHLVHVSF
jgi:hypothetical protein